MRGFIPPVESVLVIEIATHLGGASQYEVEWPGNDHQH